MNRHKKEVALIHKRTVVCSPKMLKQSTCPIPSINMCNILLRIHDIFKAAVGHTKHGFDLDFSSVNSLCIVLLI